VVTRFRSRRLAAHPLRVLLPAVLFLAALAVAGGRGGDAFTLTTLAGRTLRVGEEPRVVLLVFGARWCRPCEELVPGLRRLAASHGRRGFEVVLVGLASREDEDAFSRWARENGFEGPLVFDGERRLERRFEVREVPALVAVGPAGRVLWRGEDTPPPDRVADWLAGARP